jgi:hypothetical protein
MFLCVHFCSLIVLIYGGNIKEFVFKRGELLKFRLWTIG